MRLRFHQRRIRSCCGVCLLLICLVGCLRTESKTPRDGIPDEWPQQINFGIIATESTVGLRDEFDPFLQDLSEDLGIPVKCFFASDYAGVIEGMRFGKVDLGWFGNKSAIEAVDRAGGEVFAQTVPLNGEAGYWSTIIVHKDSPVHSVDDLLAASNELVFGNGDPHSTSGFLIPSYYLWRSYGVDPKKVFKTVLNSNHETNAFSVANRRVDFATCSTEVLKQIESQRPELFSQLRVIWTSPLIPSDPFVWRMGIPESLKERIRQFVLGYGREGVQRDRQRAVLAGISAGWAPLRPSSNDQLLPLREMMLANKLDEILSDTGKSDPRVRDLESQLNRVRERREAISSETTDLSGSSGRNEVGVE